MSNIVNEARLHLGLAAGNKVDFVASDAYSFEYNRSAFPVAQRRDITMQLGNHVTKGYGVNAMSNARHDAVLRAFPRRLFYTAVRRTGSDVLSGQMVTTALSKAYPNEGPLTWTYAGNVDRTESKEANAPDDFIGQDKSYMVEHVDFFFGGADFKIDLGSEIFRGGSLTGAYNTSTSDRGTGPGVKIRSQKNVQSGFTATMTVAVSAEAEKILDNRVGILVIREREGDWAYCIPMHVPTDPTNNPISSEAQVTLNFGQDIGPVVMGAPSSTSLAAFTVTQAGTTYSIAADKIMAA